MLSTFHNPDILSCLANLSSDEIFTPPNVANQILDTLPKDLWSDKTVTFLDPVSKSGVFLREITKRLLKGLESEIPDFEERLEHILRNQIFGIGITKLTSDISRRTLYLSKKANGKYSIVNFGDEKGNLRYFESQHSFPNRLKCKYCGADRKLYQRDKGLESYAYSFIHEDKPEELFKMKFDVIIGNPPYQLNDGGAGSSAAPIYHKFIETAKKLQPRYLSFIVPARWYNGGKGLDEFRRDMLNDERISVLHDFQDTNDVFPGRNIRGGVCYFLWEREHSGKCEVINHVKGATNMPKKRYLKEKDLDIFLRHNEYLPIYEKVSKLNELSFSNIVSSRKPFGLPTNFKDFHKEKSNDKSIYLYRFGDNGYISQDQITPQFHENINKFKVLIPKASPGDDSFPHLILGKPLISEPNSVCTETYISIGPFDDRKTCINVCNYMMTSFFRFMLLLSKSTQDVTKKTYNLIPLQNFNEDWTDEKLYKKYGINKEEIIFINSLIRNEETRYE